MYPTALKPIRNLSFTHPVITSQFSSGKYTIVILITNGNIKFSFAEVFLVRQFDHLVYWMCSGLLVKQWTNSIWNPDHFLTHSRPFLQYISGIMILNAQKPTDGLIYYFPAEQLPLVIESGLFCTVGDLSAELSEATTNFPILYSV